VKVPNRGDQRQRDGRVHTRGRHQPGDLRALQRDPTEGRFDDPQLLPAEVQPAHQRTDGLLLVERQVLVLEPVAAFDAEQV
jgi:hypothetical protein